ncbi:uroporphyrinogen-III C-methyltransferase [Thalassotalea sp. 1_MG-2023]|uniref:uroporphyrinogen-III C-methyltransferase n=1 Tax=Thalassotalea sp. 1_MG-2023 TaxID=3062680 RepID=UPI0026E352AE|nr:uroporphyrinogen-III C-methyltransferase [Thalassotalea sp. 1_MG-2023]MDO6425820.1 uroporphyrinogen-III C-methyltransferase [Thalassotalea sp. 1_MG-2023]
MLVKSIQHLSLFTKRFASYWQTNSWQNNHYFTEKTKADNEGAVFFVGAGSGDPDLLTLKAIKAFNAADVVLLDWLVSAEINQMIPANVKRVFVGKRCGYHSMSQTEICQLLVSYANQGLTVVRLKGGDPSVFGRLAEETQVLDTEHIAYQIIPGISAANGCAASSGIPLTHRECAASVKFVTAHRQNAEQDCDWQLLAQETGTLVFYMGLNKIAMICQQLIEHGMDKDTPIAVIDKGTEKDQQVCCSTINGITNQQEISCFNGPALIVVGEVVNHRANITPLIELNSDVNTLVY